jgi:hypothetical protein
MRGFKVLISLELKTRQMHFLKGQKRGKFTLKNTTKKEGPKPPKPAKNTVK